MMASTRDEFNSESGSRVFKPFSLKDSMMFQMSTRDTKSGKLGLENNSNLSSSLIGGLLLLPIILFFSHPLKTDLKIGSVYCRIS